jgi:hypothetical protein
MDGGQPVVFFIAQLAKRADVENAPVRLSVLERR